MCIRDRVWAVLLFMVALACGGFAGLCLGAPQIIHDAIRLPIHMAAAAGITGGVAAAALVAAILQLNKNRRFKKELETNTRLLQEIFARHLGDSSISPDAMKALETKMAEFLRPVSYTHLDVYKRQVPVPVLRCDRWREYE